MNRSEDHWHRSFDSLISALEEGTLTEEQATRLNQMLDSQSGARRRFAEQMQLRSLLQTEQRADGIQPIAPSSPSQPVPERRSVFAPVVAAAALAAGILAAVLWINRPPDEPSRTAAVSGVMPILDEGVAVLTRCVDVEWDESTPLTTGSSVAPGRVSLLTGHAQFEFYRGAVVVVEGPADLEFIDANRLVCHRGRLRARVPAPAEGFEVLSPKFELVDLGTEFGVDVEEDGSANVRVFEGKVELYEPKLKRTETSRTEIVGKQGASITAEGKIIPTASPVGDYVSTEILDDIDLSYQTSRLSSWRKDLERVVSDSRVIAHYAFESNPNSMRSLTGDGPQNDLPGDRTAADQDQALDGAIVGCRWSDGRWAEKGALEFKHPGDRVRLDLPGEYDSLTYAAWVRIDGLDRPFIALVLTNGYDEREPHWQLRDDGRLLLGVQTPQGHVAYDSAPVLNLRHLGRWIHLATVYDSENRLVRHYIDGNKVGETAINTDPFLLKFGDTEIGNWGTPVTYSPQKIRNFNGRIDDLTIYGDALDETEIASLYSRGRP